MSNIHVILVDDEYKSIETLESLLRYHPDITILATAKSMESALPLIEKHRRQLDILFLDIQMPGGDGFQLLEQLPEISFKVIFTTAFDQYAIKAIRFSAMDYLLKPIDHAELGTALDRYRKSRLEIQPAHAEESFKKALIKKDLFEKLAIPTAKDIMFFPLATICYMESDNNYTTVFLEDGRKIVSSKNIGYYEDLLEGSFFLRTHNFYIVNARKITRFIKGKQAYIELEGGTTLEVSLKRRDALLNYLQIS